MHRYWLISFVSTSSKTDKLKYLGIDDQVRSPVTDSSKDTVPCRNKILERIEFANVRFSIEEILKFFKGFDRTITSLTALCYNCLS